MTREDRIKLAIEKGFTYDENTGKIFSRFNREVIKKSIDGYITIGIDLDKKYINLKGHQFAYYIKYKKIVNCIDHIDGDRTNNKIDNLREVTKQENSFNTKAKGYTFNKKYNKYQAQIAVNYKRIYIGLFNTEEEEARQAYLDAKKIYHNIDVIEM